MRPANRQEPRRGGRARMMMGVVLVRDCVVCPRCLLPACLSFLFRPRSIPVVLLCSFCSRPVLLPVFSSRFPVPVFLFVCLLRSSLTPCWCPGYIVRDARPRRMRRDAGRDAGRDEIKKNETEYRHGTTKRAASKAKRRPYQMPSPTGKQGKAKHTTIRKSDTRDETSSKPQSDMARDAERDEKRDA